MDTTFISIHDLTPAARILYSSDSVIDVLGYTPEELVTKSCWDYFPPEILPYAKSFHRKKVTMDKAAVLVYCRVKASTGEWVGCECCFTVVYDVMIVCTSRYRQDQRSRDRALAAPVIRRLFSSSPRDPRYNMLSHLSTKFSLPPTQSEFEPRAALFLNRFTRTLTIMYVTHGIKDVIGLSSRTMQGLSFYNCVAENCLQDAVKCLESAKGNHSIAYLRFWYRDPRNRQPAQPYGPEQEEEEEEEAEPEAQPEPQATESQSANDEDEVMTDVITSEDASQSTVVPGEEDLVEAADLTMDVSHLPKPQHGDTRASSGDSGANVDTHQAIFGDSPSAESSSSSVHQSPSPEPDEPLLEESIELEAVVSCASDGLVVCLRRARPMIPHPAHRPGRPVYPNGLFAAPWASEPVLPPIESRARAGFGTGFAPSLGPYAARHDDRPPPPHGPPSGDFMAAIREQAIFAWALTGINGGLADFGHGAAPSGSIPEGGLRVWESDTNTYATSQNGEAHRQDAFPAGHEVNPAMMPRNENTRPRAPGPPYNDDPPPYNPNHRAPDVSQTQEASNEYVPSSERSLQTATVYSPEAHRGLYEHSRPTTDTGRPSTAFFGDPGLSRSRR